MSRGARGGEGEQRRRGQGQCRDREGRVTERGGQQAGEDGRDALGGAQSDRGGHGEHRECGRRGYRSAIQPSVVPVSRGGKNVSP